VAQSATAAVTVGAVEAVVFFTMTAEA
jgi:hypothetical protein